MPLRPARPQEKDYPISFVYDLDHTEQPPRIIRLSPRMAVAWCYADAIGQMGRFNAAEPFIYKMDNGWVCGSFWVRDDGYKET